MAICHDQISEFVEQDTFSEEASITKYNSNYTASWSKYICFCTKYDQGYWQAYDMKEIRGRGITVLAPSPAWLGEFLTLGCESAMRIR